MENNSESLTWTTVRRSVNQLIPLPHNPRKMTAHQKAELKKSLERFSLVELPVINLDGKVIAGNQRLGILLALGRANEEIEVRCPNRMLTEAEVREYAIRSNQNRGEWDLELLREHFDLNELLTYGFTQDEFHDLGLEIPAFQPVPESEQPRLDLRKQVTCPECGHEFAA
jgi:hypothetical protein